MKDVIEVVTLQKTIRTNSDSKIKEMYVEFKNQKQHGEANKLRTAYILNKVFDEDEMQLTDLLIFFANEEANDLVNFDVSIFRFDMQLRLEQIGGSKEYSGINTFLLSKLVKEGNLEGDKYSLKDICLVEYQIFSQSLFAKECVVNFLIDSELNNDLTWFNKGMIRRFERRFEDSGGEKRLYGLEHAYLLDRPLFIFDEDMDIVYNEYIQGKRNNVIEIDYFIIALLWFSQCHFEKGNVEKAKSYLIKTMNVISEDNFLFNILRFRHQNLVEEPHCN